MNWPVLQRNSTYCASAIISVVALCCATLCTWVNMHAEVRQRLLLGLCLLVNASCAHQAALREDVFDRISTMYFHHTCWKVVPVILMLRDSHAFIMIGWSSLVDIVMRMVSRTIYGDPFSSLDGVFLFLKAVVFAIGFYTFSSRYGVLYQRMQELMQSNRTGNETLLSLLCEDVLWVADDGDTIIQHRGLCELFGTTTTMGHKKLSSLVANNIDDAHRLQEAFERSKTSPVLFHGTLSVHATSFCSVDLFIVCQAEKSSFDEAIKPCCRYSFLVGVRIHHTWLYSSSGCPLSTIEDADGTRDELRVSTQLSEPPGYGSNPDGIAPAGLTLTTTKTSKSIEVSEDITDVAESMSRLACLGRKENWLIDPRELHVSPNGLLAKGALGTVVSGFLNGTDVVVKMRNSREIGRLVKSIRILRHNRHPNIVFFHGLCMVAQSVQLGLVFERVQGTILTSFIKKPPLGSSSAERHGLVLDICAALQYLHRQDPQVVHGEVKADKIMVDDISCARPCAKLLDFGITRLVSTGRRHLDESLPWMAPEVITSNQPTASADVFSFGHLLSFIMSGQSPCAGMTVREMRRMANRGKTCTTILHGSYFRKECEYMCRRCCHVRPAARPNMSTVCEAILTWVSQCTEWQASFPSTEEENSSPCTDWEASSSALEAVRRPQVFAL